MHLDGQPDARPGGGSSAELGDATAWFLSYRDARDRTGLERALLACMPSLRQAAYVLAPQPDRDDLVHEVFVVAIARARAFDGRGPLLPWLLGILRNRVRARRRELARQLASVELPPRTADDPSILVAAEQWRRTVCDHIEGMREPYRTVLERHLVDGEAPTEIAARIARPASTVRTQLERGLHLLRRRLAER